MSTLGDLTVPKIDQSGPPKTGEFTYIDISSIDNKLKKIVEPKRLPVNAAPSRAKQRLQPGDVLVSMTRPNLNAVAVVTSDLKGAIGSTGFHVLRPVEDVESRWLFYGVQTHAFVEAMSKLVQGALYPAVRPRDIRGFSIDAPSLSDQQRIVAEIEKQFSRLDEAVASLKRVKANLKRYKAAVLKAAVEGKLTEEWRLSARAASRKRAQASELETIPKAGKDKWFVYIIECNDGSYYVGHTADLHDRWQRHCEGSGADWTSQHPPKYLVHYEECATREDAVKREDDLKTGFGRTWRKREIAAGRMKPLVHNPANETAQPVHGEDMQTGSKLLERILAERRAKWDGKGQYKEPGKPNVTDLTKLPQHWAWCLTDALFSFVTSGSRGWAQYYSDEGPLFLRVGNLDHDSIRLDLSDVQRVKPPAGAEGTRTRVESGDILISITADVGMIAVAPTDLGDAYINQHVSLVRPLNGFCREYLAWYLAARDGGQKMFLQLQRGATKVGLGLDDIRAVPVPLPPLAEQQEIVAEVERRLSVIDELEAAVEANLTRADRLRQSVLGSAFSGQLIHPEGN